MPGMYMHWLRARWALHSESALEQLAVEVEVGVHVIY